ncbi:hypothetical protein VP1G_11359 [Cytospora mali]|uniref:Uncharacterized protein n=1 Tax=Cytospora mali TaxID=578113 RepID=A0A194VDP4_CYTMA|nr:hypothetical protein VP1G_11359 [Valsa mali var. pyri (nom. inval.)]
MDKSHICFLPLCNRGHHQRGDTLLLGAHRDLGRDAALGAVRHPDVGHDLAAADGLSEELERRLVGLLASGANLLPHVREVARIRRDQVVAARQVKLGHLVLVIVAAVLWLARRRINLLASELESVGEGGDGQGALTAGLLECHVDLAGLVLR